MRTHYALLALAMLFAGCGSPDAASRAVAAGAADARARVQVLRGHGLLLGVVGVQPGPGVGTITMQVLEHELREARGGTTIGRVQVEK